MGRPAKAVDRRRQRAGRAPASAPDQVRKPGELRGRMSTTAPVLKPVPQVTAHEIQRPRQTKRWIDWITTTDHKKIGIMYLVLTFVFFMLGGVEALMMRAQLSVPNNTLISAQHYNQLLTMHGTT